MRPDPRPGPGRGTATGRLPRRGTDRVEDAVAWLVIAAGLVLLVVAVVLGLGVHGQEAERARSESATRTEVHAVLLEDAPIVMGEYGSTRAPVRASARFTGPDGRPHVAQVPVLSARSAGSDVTVWVDHDGTVTAPPTTAGNAVVAGLLSALGVLLLGGCVLACVWTGVRRLTALGNARAWEREWARVGPEWSRHLR